MRRSSIRLHRLLSSSSFASLILLISAPSAAVALSQASTRDSVGVRIVTYKIDRTAIQLANPAVTITDTDQCTFSRIASIHAHAGGFVIANGRESAVCSFDRDGRFLRRVGRRGNGPGEFMILDGAYAKTGDSILVYDGMLQRVTILAPNGTFARSVTVEPPAGLRTASAFVPLADDILLMGFNEFRNSPPIPDPISTTQRLVTYDLTGKALAQAGSFPHSQIMALKAPPEHGGTAYPPLVFGRRLSIAPFANGFVAGDGSTLRIDQYAPSGRLVASHRVTEPVRSVTQKNIDKARRDTLERVSEKDRPALDSVLDQIKYPKTFPAYTRFVADPVGRIWIEPFAIPGEAKNRWLVLDVAAGWIRPVTLPGRLQLRAASSTQVCGSDVDEVGLVTIKCFAHGLRSG